MSDKVVNIKTINDILPITWCNRMGLLETLLIRYNITTKKHGIRVVVLDAYYKEYKEYINAN